LREVLEEGIFEIFENANTIKDLSNSSVSHEKLAKELQLAREKQKGGGR